MSARWTGGPVRSALFLPASNPRAMAKARTLDCDMVILDLEDAVPAPDKAAAREAVVAAGSDWRAPLVAVRINDPESEAGQADLVALRTASRCDLIVVPKVESAKALPTLAGRRLLAMIEGPEGVLAARSIAEQPDVVGLIAGTNDLAEALRLPPDPERVGLTLALQTIVLAARAQGLLALDGVCNALDDPDRFAVECAAGRRLGFDGKTLIHPSQIAPANRLFGPSEAELEDARALVAAATGGAERFRGRMIEAMHVRAAERLIAQAQARDPAADAT